MTNDKFILLAEDDANDVLLLERAFEKAGLGDSLKIVRDGDQALQYFDGRDSYADRKKFPLPFLLLLDLKMPGTDGFEVLQRLRQDPEFKRLLIVVLTSSNRQSDVDRAYEMGANSYLVKPVSFEEMANLIRRFEMYWTEINRTPSTPAAGYLAPSESTLA